jgi:hypothetical protein
MEIEARGTIPSARLPELIESTPHDIVTPRDEFKDCP